MSIDAQVPYVAVHTVPRVEKLALNAHFITATAGLGPHSARPIGQPAFSRPIPSEAGPLDVIGRIAKFAGNTQIYGEQDPANYLYHLDSGLARAYGMTADGRRQIVAFYVPGDFFGFEMGKNHTLSVEVVTFSKIRMMKRATIMAIAAQDEDVALQLNTGYAYEFRRNQEHILQLGKEALERVAGFVLEMSRRLPNSGTIELPMSRQDIADYLCITIETVSRSLTQLKRMAAITVISAREITVRNPGLLKRLMSHSG